MPFKVHPGIGIARVGNSPDWFIGPVTADPPELPAGGYKDARGRTKRQAASFRVFSYPALGAATEVMLPTEIRWVVTTGDGVVEVTGPNRRELLPEHTLASGRRVNVGEVRTDTNGRLIFLTGLVDDEFDGRVQAVIHAFARATPSSPEEAADAPSWVMGAAPDFAPFRESRITGHDILLWRYVRDRAAGTLSWDPPVPTRPSYTRDIFPILRRLSVAADHDPLDRAVTLPPAHAGVPSDPAILPNYVTPVQRNYLVAWQGTPGADWENDWALLRDVPRLETPEELDRGPLSHTVGAALSAGWDFSLGMVLAAYSAPFRLAAPTPTGLSAVGWFGELSVCGGEWLAGTASQVLSTTEPTSHWQNFGFEIPIAGTLTITERGFYVLLLTPTLDFGRVPRQPGSSPSGGPLPGVASMPVVFEVGPGDVGTVTFEFLPFAAGSGLSVDFVPAPLGASSEIRTVRLWVRFDTPPASAGAEVTLPPTTIQVRARGVVYDIDVRAVTVNPVSTQVALVLDHSFSMREPRGDGSTKLQGLIEAVTVLVDTARQGDGIGVAPFNHLAPDVPGALDVTPIGPPIFREAGREAVTRFVRALSADGSTSIGAGLQSGRRLLARTSGYAGTALVVVTDGKETALPHINDVAASIDSRTFAVGIGQENNVDVSTLQTLTGNRGGYLLLTGSILGRDNEFILQKFLLQILAQARNDQIILDPALSLLPGRVESVPFYVTEDDRLIEVIALYRSPKDLVFELETPAGERITESSHPSTTFVRSERVAFFRVGLPLPEARDSSPVGRWTARLGRRAVDNEQQPAPEPALLMVHARSDLELKTSVNTSRGPGGSPLLHIEATLTRHRAPFEGRATLSAELGFPDGRTLTLPLREDLPGRFVARFEPVTAGLYRVRVLARGDSLHGARFERELTSSAVVSWADPAPPRDTKATTLTDALECLFDCAFSPRCRRWLALFGVKPERVIDCLKEREQARATQSETGAPGNAR